VSKRIHHRKQDLKRRREALLLATSTLSQDVAAEALQNKNCRERGVQNPSALTLRSSVTLPTESQPTALQHRILPIRASLITTLATLFPIDLISGSDLLFGILHVPLPIPLGTTDPAPPLSLPAYKEVNEEGVATALGHAAFVVERLAVYLDKMLVYPITFCGSRSMIRDGISAMVGPRMCVLQFDIAHVDQLLAQVPVVFQRGGHIPVRVWGVPAQ
jgi:hypothetical protein